MFGMLAKILIKRPFKEVYRILENPETVNLTLILCTTVSRCSFVISDCRSILELVGLRDGTSVFVPHASFLSRDNIGEIITDVAISSDIVL
jgi:hypothetical protein